MKYTHRQKEHVPLLHEHAFDIWMIIGIIGALVMRIMVDFPNEEETIGMKTMATLFFLPFSLSLVALIYLGLQKSKENMEEKKKGSD